MLTALGVDGNYQLFLLAFAIVEDENNNSWRWFMACIWTRVTHQPDLCIISDRHRNIISAMNDDALGGASDMRIIVSVSATSQATFILGFGISL